MSAQHFIGGTIPERFVEVDAARLLLILVRFARPLDTEACSLRCLPPHPVSGHFTPEYYLHKLDFLLRYPDYFAYELIELHRLKIVVAANRDEIRKLVRTILRDREPELMTTPFRRFWRGAYERIDAVESWLHSRELVYTGLEPRGNTSSQKHYFTTDQARVTAERLVVEVSESRWYADRVALIHRFFGGLTPAQVKNLQYGHAAYREAQIAEAIPSLSSTEIQDAFELVFHEPIGVDLA